MKKHRKSTPSPWPTFIFQENQPSSLVVILWAIFTYIIILFALLNVYNIEMVPASHPPLTIIYEQSYIDTNDANTTTSQNPRYYGAHNQSAAQENPSISIDEDPTITGSELSQQISQTIPIDEAVSSDDISAQMVAGVDTAPGRTLQDFLKKDDLVNEDGETIPPSDVSVNEDDQYIALNRKRHRQKICQSTRQRIDIHKNKRAHIQKIRSIPAPLRKSETSVSKLGKISMNVQGSKFGEYEQRLLEAISYRWQLLSARFSNSPPAGEVIIKFILNKDGTITNLDVARHHTSYEAALICADAVFSQSPQPEWSNDMIIEVGNKKQMMVKFIYY